MPVRRSRLWISACVGLFGTVAAAAPANPGNAIEVFQSEPALPFSYPERLEGDFTQVSEAETSYGTSTTTITGHVVWRLDLAQDPDALPSLPPPGEKAGFPKSYSAVTADLAVDAESTVTNYAGTCRNQGTYKVTLSLDERRSLKLTIDDQSRYSLTLVAKKTDARFDIKGKCKFAAGMTIDSSDRVYGVVVVLGSRTGALTNGGVVGRVSEPIAVGPDQVTGSWTFAVNSGRKMR